MSKAQYSPLVSLGNILTIVSLIFMSGVTYSTVQSGINEVKLLRSQDLVRIERLESGHDSLRDKVYAIERTAAETGLDIKYIKSAVDDLKAGVDTTKRLSLK